MRRSAAGFFTFFLALLVAQLSLAHAQDGTRGVFSLSVVENGKSSNVPLYSHSFALVIGIDKYDDPAWPSLSNAINDAQAIKSELEQRGFEVQFETDLKSAQLKKTIEDFIYEKGRHRQARLFIWYAGHGHTIDGEGYLVPSDAPSADKEDWRFRRKSLSLREFSRFMREARAKHVMTVFDSCFSGTVFSTARSKPPSVITRATTQKVRQFVSSGEAKQTVSDNGLFRKLFLDAITGKDARADMNGDGYVIGSELGLYLHQRVTNLTNNRQTPRSGKLNAYGYDLGDFVFRVGTGASTPAAKTTGPGEGGLMAAMRKRLAALEEQLKKRLRSDPKPAPEPDAGKAPGPTKKEKMIRQVQALLAEQGYKPGPADGKYGLDTRDAVLAFQRDMGTHSRGLGFGKIDQRLLTALKMASRTRKLDARRKAREGETRKGEKKVAVGVFPEKQPTPRNRFTPGTIFDDCNGEGWCPEMVIVPKGSFMMGSKSGDKDEKPVHRVTIGKRFAVGRFEITVKEYQRCVDDGSCKKPEWRELGNEPTVSDLYKKPWKALTGDRFPIVGVSWNNAKAYLKWLGKKAGKKYRLLSEAEWEYVARGNKGDRKYWWGGKASHEYANYGEDECCLGLKKGKDKWKYTSPVGSFSENPFKVHDMHGNVMEWVEDCYKDSYKGAPTDGGAMTFGSCGNRVLRGGSWILNPSFLRSANRNWYRTVFRGNNLGFRVARSLPLARTR